MRAVVHLAKGIEQPGKKRLLPLFLKEGKASFDDLWVRRSEVWSPFFRAGRERFRLKMDGKHERW